MGQALTERLSMLPAGAFAEILKLTGAVDETKGWWEGHSRSSSQLLGSLREIARAATYTAIGEDLRVGTRFLERVSRHEPELQKAGCRYLGLLESVLETWAEVPLDEESILDLHGRLADPTGERSYRTGPLRSPLRDRRSLESIALDPVSPDRISHEVKSLTAWTASQLRYPSSHPLLVIGSFLLEFLAIHPFGWGNRRISVILANLLLMQAGYSYMPYASLERAIADRRPYYDIALRNAMVSRKMPRPDVSPWLTEFLQVLRAQAAQLRMVAERHAPVDLLSENQVRVMALFAVHREITVRLVALELRLSRATAKQVLSRLHRLGLVHRFGSGRAVRYGQAR